MAKQTLPINFVDDILAQPMGGKRKFAITDNGDGTYSIEDVTEYTQIGSDFGASQMNQTNQAVNDSCDKADVIDDLDDIVANQAGGMIAGAKAVAELISKIPEEDNGHLKFADGTLIQWGRATVGSNGAAIVDFGTPFINISYVIQATPEYYSGTPTFTLSTQRSTASRMIIYTRTTAGVVISGVNVYWMVIGRWK